MTGLATRFFWRQIKDGCGFRIPAGTVVICFDLAARKPLATFGTVDPQAGNDPVAANPRYQRLTRGRV